MDQGEGYPGRGSERILQDRIGQRALPKEDLQQLVAFSQQDGVELVDIWIYGQPDPDVVSGSFQVNPEVAASVVQDLIRQRVRYHLDIFPYGVPALGVRDIVQIGFTSRGLK